MNRDGRKRGKVNVLCEKGRLLHTHESNVPLIDKGEAKQNEKIYHAE